MLHRFSSRIGINFGAFSLLSSWFRYPTPLTREQCVAALQRALVIGSQGRRANFAAESMVIEATCHSSLPLLTFFLGYVDELRSPVVRERFGSSGGGIL